MPTSHYVLPMGAPLVGSSVRVYRSAALSTGSAGSFATISWDQETESGIAHSAGVFTVPITGDYDWEGGITIGTSGASEFRAIVEVDSGGGYAEVDRASVTGGTITLGLLTLGPGTASFGRRVPLVAGDLVRVRFASFSAGTVALVVGESATWFAMRLVG